MPLSQHQRDLLAEVTRARTALRTLRSELEAEVERKIALARDASDLAIRKAYNAGARKADILRASGTRNFGTIQESLDRTEGVSVALDEAAPSQEFEWDDLTGGLRVTIAGDTAIFDVQRRGSDDYIFYTDHPLWNNDYTVKNLVVDQLDGVTFGPLWERANAWVRKQKK